MAMSCCRTKKPCPHLASPRQQRVNVSATVHGSGKTFVLNHVDLIILLTFELLVERRFSGRCTLKSGCQKNVHVHAVKQCGALDIF